MLQKAIKSLNAVGVISKVFGIQKNDKNKMRQIAVKISLPSLALKKGILANSSAGVNMWHTI